MTRWNVHPGNAQEVLSKIAAGDEAIFSSGRYPQVLKLTSKSGTAAQPIVLRGQPGACISAGISADNFRQEANRRSKELENENCYPGLYPWLLDGRLKLTRCEHIVIRDFTFELSWPTHIALSDCRNIAISGSTFLDGTFAIAAAGNRTYGIAIDGCSWVQDRVPGRLWQQIPWWRVHGDRRDGYPPVDIDNDWRLFDGDFFRGDEIRGGVHIRNCSVRQAFNAIHLFNDDMAATLSLDVEVQGCAFVEIRDNVLEAEKVAQNWWFHDNEIHDCHKWFSFECVQSRYFYVFGNRCWFSSLQGTPHPLDHGGGGTLKLGKAVRRPYGPHYFFHNSISTRSDHARKGVLPGLNHINNAIRIVQPGDPLFTVSPDFFGDLSAPRSAIKKRFTSEWLRYGIEWRNDVVFYAGWPEDMRPAGYPIGEPDLGLDPANRAPFAGDLKLLDRRPCGGAGVALDVELPDRTVWHLQGGQDIGAWQGETIFAGPGFRPVENPAEGFERLPGKAV